MSKHKHHNRSYNNQNNVINNSIENTTNESDILSENIVDENTQEDITTNNVSETVIQEENTEIETVTTENNEEIYSDIQIGDIVDITPVVETVDETVIDKVEEPIKQDNTLIEEVNDEIHTIKEPEVKSEEPVQKVMPVGNFYRVGTGFINNKCVNQIAASSDLGSAKECCDNARNTCKKTYYVFDKQGNDVYTAEYTSPKDNYYRVGTEWRNGMCIDQKFSSIDLNKAIESANDNTKLTGVIHHIFDPSGKVVFSAKKKLTLFSLRKRGNKNDSWYS